MTELPAVLGASPIRPQGPPPWPPPDPDVLAALTAAYHDGSWGKYHGGHCERLEDHLRTYHQVDHVLLCGSGTFAVELALRSVKIGPGDEVLLAGYDFPGNFLAVHAVGAHPVLADVEPANWNLGLGHLDAAVSKTTRAAIVSHLHGGFVPMAQLMAWAAQRRIHVIEDAAQCPGATIGGKKAGTWGDVGTLSFGGSKLLTAGRGGAILTRHADVFQRARTSLLRGNLVCPLSELQAAVLLPQWHRLDERNRGRRDAVRFLTELLADVPGLVPFVNPPGDDEPAYYKVGFRFDKRAFGLDRATFLAAVRAEGIAFDDGFQALHVNRSPRRYRAGSALTEAERAHAGAVILHHPVLLEGEPALREVADSVRKVHSHASRLRDRSGKSLAEP